MEKIISIQLAGQILSLEEPAYNALMAYFQSLRAYFHNQEGSEEILTDIETRTAELLQGMLCPGIPTLGLSHIEAVKAQMGSVEDFREAEGSPEPEAAGQEPASEDRGHRRFFRNPEDKVVGGVCSGLAGYFNVDPALIRIIFGVLTLGGWGTGILLYIVLWMVVPESTVNAYRGRRIYRSEEDKWIGGVCGGLAVYFDKDPWLFRLLFGVPLLFGTGSGLLHGLLGSGLFLGSFSGALLLIYLLLWSVLPVARTDFQKRELRGERIDIHTIRDNIYTDLKSSGQHLAQGVRAAYEETGKPFLKDAQQTLARSGRSGASVLARIVQGILLFVGIVISFLLFALLITYFFGGISDTANRYLFDSTRQKTMAFISAVLLLGMPLLLVLMAILRSTLRLPMRTRYVNGALILLWIAGFGTLAALGSSIGKGFQYEEAVEESFPIAVSDTGTLLLKASGTPIRYRNTLPGIHGSFSGLDINADSLRSSWISFRTVPSPDSDYHAVVRRTGFGTTPADAHRRAQNISYPIPLLSADTTGTFTLPAGFGIAQPDHYRGQQVAVEIQVPSGRKVRFDPSVDAILPLRYNAERNYGYNRHRKQWVFRHRTRVTPESNQDYILNEAGELRPSNSISEPAVLTSALRERRQLEARRDSLQEALERLEDSFDDR